MTQCQGIYDYTLIDFDGNEVSLAQYKGTHKVILIVNIAMDDGLTFRNNKELEILHSKYHDKLEILAILSDDFAVQHSIPQKPSIGNIKTFQNTKVTGDQAHPLFTYLTSATDNLPINWNFCKFLINQHGKPVKRYQPTINPLKIEPDILTYFKSSEL